MRNTFLILLLSITALTGTATPALGTNRRADMNRDGELDVGDVNVILQSILTQENNQALDINDDGKVDVGDVNLALNLILNPEPYHAPEEYISGTLPVMYINTEGYRTVNSKDYYWDATYWLDPMGQHGVEAIGSETAPLRLQIKGRGNYTWTLDKKPYRIKLETKVGLLGMNKSKHWCLLPHSDDYLAYMRDEIGFELGKALHMSYTPSQQPIELVLNGDYAGLYFVCEKIRVDKDRVNITEQKDNETNSYNITGGWLLEIDNYGDGNTIKLTENGSALWITPESPEVLSRQQTEYITQQLMSLIEAVHGDDLDNPEWQQLLDVTSAAQYYIVQEMLDNIEGYHGSCYLYKDRGEDKKFMFGPMWDFGSAFFRALENPDEQHFMFECDYKQQHFISGLVRYPAFQQEVRRLWIEFYNRKAYFDVLEHCQQFFEKISPAATSDFKRWPDGESSWFDTRYQQFRQLFINRCAWLNNQWNKE